MISKYIFKSIFMMLISYPYMKTFITTSSIVLFSSSIGEVPSTGPDNDSPTKLDNAVPTPETPRKKRLRKKVQMYKTRWSRLKKQKTAAVNCKIVLRELDNLLPPKTAKFVKAQINLNKKNSKHAYRWSMDDKLFCLSVFYYSRKAYYLLRQLFALPSKRTLLRTLQRINLYPGFNDQVFDALKAKVATFDVKEKQCVLVFDEISLKSYVQYNPQGDFIEGLENFGGNNQSKKVANHAIAFLVRGLASKWKQPIGYFLSSGTMTSDKLQTLVKSCLDKLFDIGLNVKVLVCDQGSNNRSFVETMENVSVSKPFFIHNDHKIFVMYDPPHLLKNIRNNLKRSGFLYRGKSVLWKYIEEFYNFDRQHGIRIAPRLTKRHIDMPAFKEMNVDLAAQVLSHSVAAGITLLVGTKKFPAKAKYTAEFIEKFDKLFNAFNSGSMKSKNPMRHAISANSGHKEFLKEMQKFLDKVKLKPKKGKREQSLPCLQGWKISIASLLEIWDYLH